MALDEQYYAAARQEILTRISQRDNMFGGYLAFLGAIIALAFSEGDAPSGALFLAVPWVGASAAILLGQHHVVIGALGGYLRNEWKPASPAASRHWDESDSLELVRRSAVWSRTITHAVIVLGSSGWALHASRSAEASTTYQLLWWSGLVFSLASGGWLLWCQWLRQDVQ
jgi:hypothetical protein